jgi:hypothetical protein
MASKFYFPKIKAKFMGHDLAHKGRALMFLLASPINALVNLTPGVRAVSDFCVSVLSFSVAFLFLIVQALVYFFTGHFLVPIYSDEAKAAIFKTKNDLGITRGDQTSFEDVLLDDKDKMTKEEKKIIDSAMAEIQRKVMVAQSCQRKLMGQGVEPFSLEEIEIAFETNKEALNKAFRGVLWGLALKSLGPDRLPYKNAAALTLSMENWLETRGFDPHNHAFSVDDYEKFLWLLEKINAGDKVQ